MTQLINELLSLTEAFIPTATQISDLLKAKKFSLAKAKIVHEAHFQLEDTFASDGLLANVFEDITGDRALLNKTYVIVTEVLNDLIDESEDLTPVLAAQANFKALWKKYS